MLLDKRHLVYPLKGEDPNGVEWLFVYWIQESSTDGAGCCTTGTNAAPTPTVTPVHNNCYITTDSNSALLTPLE